MSPDTALDCRARWRQLSQLCQILGILTGDFLSTLARTGSRKGGYWCSSLHRLLGLLDEALPLIEPGMLEPTLEMDDDLRDRLLAKLVHLVRQAQEVR